VCSLHPPVLREKHFEPFFSVRCVPVIHLVSEKNGVRKKVSEKKIFFSVRCVPVIHLVSEKNGVRKKVSEKKKLFFCVVFPSFTWCQKRILEPFFF
jgi:hypothetical protein